VAEFPVAQLVSQHRQDLGDREDPRFVLD
jgi:hypothetical protein